MNQAPPTPPQSHLHEFPPAASRSVSLSLKLISQQPMIPLGSPLERMFLNCVGLVMGRGVRSGQMEGGKLRGPECEPGSIPGGVPFLLGPGHCTCSHPFPSDMWLLNAALRNAWGEKSPVRSREASAQDSCIATSLSRPPWQH